MDFDFSTFDEIDQISSDNVMDDIPQEDFGNDGLPSSSHSESLGAGYRSMPNVFGGMDFTSLGGAYEGGGELDQLGAANADVGLVPFEDWLEAEHGSPTADAAVWHEQSTPFTCGVVAAENVLDMFGVECNEAGLMGEAMQAGALSTGGMELDSIQQLLESNGVHAHIDVGNMNSLAQELDLGHKVIVPLDSGEIWLEDSPLEDFNMEKADHAVVVTGIDTDSNPPVVILNDPGRADGRAMRVPLSRFEDAWADSGNQYLATDSSPE
jgi:predicted double-glycine peptidase